MTYWVSPTIEWSERSKFIYYLLGEKAYDCLKSLDPSLLPHIRLVVVGKDKQVQEDFSTAITDFCREANIPCVYRQQFEPEKLVDKQDIHIAIGWRWLIPVNIHQLIVFHDSLLPKYRGFNPTVTALLNGDREIGVTALLGAAEFDQGPILGQASQVIDYPMKIQEAIRQISGLYSGLLNSLMSELLQQGYLIGRVQKEEDASISVWRDEEDYWLDWSESSDYLMRFIHAKGFPYLGAKTRYKGEIIRIIDAKSIKYDLPIENRKKNIGKCIRKSSEQANPMIICGKGLLEITEAIDEQGKKIQFQEFRIRFSS